MNTTTIMGHSTDSLLNSLVHCSEGPSGLLYSFPKADRRSLAGELLREWKLCQASDRHLTLFLHSTHSLSGLGLQTDSHNTRICNWWRSGAYPDR